jgi:dipeptidyl aminopeptidase/acylaminoacyl peptidase
MTQTKTFRPKDLLRQVRLTGLAIAPSGESAVYARQTIEGGKYRSRLWRVATGGGRPGQLTFADANDGSPSFSPDGASLAFISDRTETPQVWVMPVNGGEPRMIAGFPDGAGAVAWSPDGQTLAVVAPSGEHPITVGDAKDPVARVVDGLVWRIDGQGPRDARGAVWTVASNGRGKPDRMTSADHDVHGVFWHPGGSRIGFLAIGEGNTLEETLARAFSIPASRGTARRLSTLQGEIIAASWSPDGVLTMVGNDASIEEPWANYSVYLGEGARQRRLTDASITTTNVAYGDHVLAGFEPPAPAWLDEEHIVAIASDRGRVLPYRFGLDGTTAPLIDADEVFAPEFAVGGGRVVAIAAFGETPPELYDITEGAPRRLTQNGARWFGGFAREPERIERFASSGRRIDTWLLRGGPGRRRTVVVVHGGPHAAFTGTPWLEMTALASAGFHVVWANPAGSTSYGEPFARSLHGHWGTPDARQLLSLIDRLAAQGIVDRSRVGAVGLSYGGYLVNWLAGRHPRRFAAFVGENPVADLIGEWGSADWPGIISEYAIDAGPRDDQMQAMLDASPFRKLSRNRSPFLHLQADGDLRCPPLNTELAYLISKRHGVTTRMVRYPDESHGLFIIGRPDRRVDRLERIVDWFDRYV